jgi:hypothetical protein
MNGLNIKTGAGRVRLVAVLCCLLMAFVVACGDDDEPTNNGTTNNGTVDAGDTDGVDDAGDTGEVGVDGGTDGGDVDEDTGDADQCEGLGLNATCDPKCQTGCEINETCVPTRASADEPTSATCSPEGTAGQGEACGETGCQPGFGCYGTDTDDATCQEICQPSEGDDACAAEGTFCQAFESGVDIGRCVIPEAECEVFPPEDSCGEDLNCYPTDVGGTVCAPFDPDALVGDECDGPDACNDLQACAGPEGGPLTCVEKCDPTAEANRCDEGEQCVAFEGNDLLGACTATGS